jgi:hypothetical protein
MLELEDYFHPKTLSPIHRKVFVVHGLCGMGKTQLAIEFARRHKGKYSAVFWLDGSSRDRVKQAFVDMAYRIPPEQISADAAEALKSSSIDIDVVVGGVLRWLSLPSNQHWLIIFDNVDRDYPNQAKDPQAYDVTEFFPPADHGSFLITSRSRELNRYGYSGILDEAHTEHAKRVILGNNAGRLIKSEPDYESVTVLLQKDG